MREMNKIILVFILAVIVLFNSCKTEKKQEEKTPIKVEAKIEVPNFNADSAYSYVEKQVNYGPRVPNTEAHKKCAIYLENKLKEFGAEVIVQQTMVKAYDGTNLFIKNIIGQYKPENKTRVMLMAHWDSRPFADHSENPERRDSPILGANDGASGVGILLEIARQFSQSNPKIGVDIIFFDAEDYGYPDHKNIPHKENTWCLGSQYWARNNHVAGYYARYGILLDMVGAPNAIFGREGTSMYYAEWLVDKVWGVGTQLGYSNHFDYRKTGPITDDHTYINSIANIPAIDIIQYEPSSSTYFGHYWHTENDNMDNIDKNTLKAVGQTVLHVVYHEK